MRASLGLAAAVLAVAFTGAPPVFAQAAEKPSEKRGDSLRHLGVEVEGESRALQAIRLEGLSTLREGDVWAALGGRPAGTLTFEVATDVIRGLERLESFARIDPGLEVTGGEVALRIRLTEHPRIAAATVVGLTEDSEGAVVTDFLGSVPALDEQPTGVQAPWLANLGADGFQPGILRGGLGAGATRVMASLLASGRRMASVGARLSPDGSLTVEVDEGRIESVRLVGPVPSVDREVAEVLDLSPGRTFLEADVEAGIERVRKAYPFLVPARIERPSRALPVAQVAEKEDGSQVVTLVEAPPSSATAAFETEGHRLTVHFRPKHSLGFGVSGEDVLRHTPVAGVGVGVHVDMKLWDPSNRVHVEVETFLSSVDEKTREAVTEDSSEAGAMLRFRVPRLRIAELGVQGWSLMQTDDQWRTGRQTSYLNSLFFNEPHREYFWEEAASVFVTAQPARRTLLGVGYNDLRDHSVSSLLNPPSLFNDDTPFPNPSIDAGRIGSLVFRAEYQSDPIRPTDLVGILRSSQDSLVRRGRAYGMHTGFATFATLEVAREGLGSDPGLSFTRFVTDSSVFLATGAQSGLRIRGRLTGGSNLPLQRQADLGGWGALRGYDFKEFRGGDWSILTMLEYRHSWISGFLDVGSLHDPDEGWMTPKAGIGAKVHIESLPTLGSWLKRWRKGPSLTVAAAWRLDGQMKLQPELLLQVGHLF